MIWHVLKITETNLFPHIHLNTSVSEHLHALTPVQDEGFFCELYRVRWVLRPGVKGVKEERKVRTVWEGEVWEGKEWCLREMWEGVNRRCKEGLRCDMCRVVRINSVLLLDGTFHS
jgi:hypothetical protein